MVNEIIFCLHAVLIMLFIRAMMTRGSPALIALAALQSILANLFVLKTITLFSLAVTPSDAYTIGSMICINVLRECFGKKAAKQVIGLNVLFTLFFICMSFIQISYIPDSLDTAHSLYKTLLTPSFRILSASLCTFFISQLVDYKLYGAFRKRFAIRSAMVFSLLFSQLLDTVLFSFAGLCGIAPNLYHIIFFSYLVKVATLLLMGFLTKPLLAYEKVKHA